jgi:hypothetical protein
MIGFSAKIFTDRRPDPVAFPPLLLVTSRNLLDGILTVKRMDFLDSSGKFDGVRETVTAGKDTKPRVTLLDLKIVLEVCWLGGLAVAVRDRRERPVDMIDNDQGINRKQTGLGEGMQNIKMMGGGSREVR